MRCSRPPYTTVWGLWTGPYPQYGDIRTGDKDQEIIAVDKRISTDIIIAADKRISADIKNHYQNNIIHLKNSWSRNFFLYFKKT